MLWRNVQLRPGLTWDNLPKAKVVQRIDVELVLDILDMVQGLALSPNQDRIEIARQEVLRVAHIDDPRGA
jgi:hypothetical protein